MSLDPYLSRITVGDSRELAQVFPNNSVDLIFTDPPYLKTDVQGEAPIYEWLASEAARVLKPGGFLLSYVGSLWKYENMLQMGKHLTYFYDYIALHRGSCTLLWCRRTVTRHKSILAFVKGSGRPRCTVLSTFMGGGVDKRFHRWGQDEQTARYFIDCFSEPGALVWEPFCGGGTVPYVCAQLGRACIAFERDPDTAARAQARLDTLQPRLPGLTSEQFSFESDQTGDEAGFTKVSDA